MTLIHMNQNTPRIWHTILFYHAPNKRAKGGAGGGCAAETAFQFRNHDSDFGWPRPRLLPTASPTKLLYLEESSSTRSEIGSGFGWFPQSGNIVNPFI